DEKASRPREQPKDGTTVRGMLEAVQPDKNSITISTYNRKDDQRTDKTFQVAKDATIEQDGSKVKLADLKKGNTTILKLSADQKTAVSITVEGVTMRGRFKREKAERNTITVFAGGMELDRILHLVKETKVLTEDRKPTTVKGLKVGTNLLLTLPGENSNTFFLIQATPAEKDK